ncbi:hypothetical protein NL676_013257 [Syzygium grande]|nr:hypothetical protein NL676_013257 [Syzygium grande]
MHTEERHPLCQETEIHADPKSNVHCASIRPPPELHHAPELKNAKNKIPTEKNERKKRIHPKPHPRNNESSQRRERWGGRGRGESIGYLNGTATDFLEDDLLEAIDALASVRIGAPRPAAKARCSRATAAAAAAQWRQRGGESMGGRRRRAGRRDGGERKSVEGLLRPLPQEAPAPSLFHLSAFLLSSLGSLCSSSSSASRFSSSRHSERSREDDHRKANLVRFPLSSSSDKRGWLLDPASVGIQGSGVSADASVDFSFGLPSGELVSHGC